MKLEDWAVIVGGTNREMAVIRGKYMDDPMEAIASYIRPHFGSAGTLSLTDMVGDPCAKVYLVGMTDRDIRVTSHVTKVADDLSWAETKNSRYELGKPFFSD